MHMLDDELECRQRLDCRCRRITCFYYAERAIPVIVAWEHFKLLCTTDLLLSQQLLQLSCIEHLLSNISTTHKFAFHIQLRDGGPLAVVLDRLTQTRVVHLQEKSPVTMSVRHL